MENLSVFSFYIMGSVLIFLSVKYKGNPPDNDWIVLMAGGSKLFAIHRDMVIEISRHIYPSKSKVSYLGYEHSRNGVGVKTESRNYVNMGRINPGKTSHETVIEYIKLLRDRNYKRKIFKFHKNVPQSITKDSKGLMKTFIFVCKKLSHEKSHLSSKIYQKFRSSFYGRNAWKYAFS